MTVDTDHPVLTAATARIHGRLLFVRYRVSEQAHVALLFDGKRVVDTPLEPLTGKLVYRGPVAAERHRSALVHAQLLTVDFAQNRCRRA